MLSSQILLGRKIQIFTVVGDRSKRGHLGPRVSDRTVQIRTNRIPTSTTLRADVLRRLIDRNERPSLIDQLSFLNRVPEFCLVFWVRPIVLWPS